MNLLLNFIALIIIVISTQISFADERVCVLNFEREQHPFTQKTSDYFYKNPNVDVITEATPIDFYNCVTAGYSEIIIIAHAFQYEAADLSKFKLGFFLRDSADVSQSKINSAIDRAEKRYLSSQGSFKKSCLHYLSPRTPISKKNKCFRLKRNRRNSKNWLESLKNLPADHPTYKPSLFYNRPFILAKKFLAEEKTQNASVRLKSLRLLGCSPKEVLKGHPPLAELLKDNSITLDTAPKQNISSWLKGRYVTTLDPTWVKESAQFNDPENNDDSFFAYIKLKTYGVYRTGSTTALRGKYKISIKGAALGLSHKWSRVYIYYREVENLKVGETLIINRPQLDFSLALWLNAEVQVTSRLRAFGPSEINSLGASMGAYQAIKVKRLY